MAESELCWKCKESLKKRYGVDYDPKPSDHCHHEPKEKEHEVRVSDLGFHIIDNKPIHRVWIGIVIDRMFEKYIECPWGEEEKYCLWDKVILAKKEVEMVANKYKEKPKCWCDESRCPPGKNSILEHWKVKVVFCPECGRTL